MSDLTPLQYIATAVIVLIVGIAAALVFGAFARGGQDPDTLADQAEALRADQCSKEDGWIADIEKSLPILKAELDRLRLEYPTKDSVAERLRIRMAIYDGERSLEYLRRRRVFDPTDRRQSAATVFEGRM